MSFPRYPGYKDSGVEWLGQVPTNWGISTLGRISTHKCDGPFGSGLKSDHYVPSGARVVRLQNIRDGRFDGTDEVFVDEEYFRTELLRHEVRGGDVLVAGLGDDNNTVGRACVAPSEIGPALVKADCFRFRIDRRLALPSFVALQLTAGSKADAGNLSTGSTRSRISLLSMATRKVVLPPIPDQKLIVRFATQETAKIDELIADQQRLIELLEEKRGAVICHAVTKGLNPDAPTKPSGVNWLGDIPAHWSVAHLNRLVESKRRITYGIVQPGERDENGRYMVRGQDYSFGWAAPETLFRVSDAIEIPYKRARLRSGDLVITIVGAGVGNVAIVPRWLEGANLTQTTARVAVDPLKADSRFVAAFLQSPVGKRSVDYYAKGAAQPGLNIEHVRIFPVTLPPLSEQRAIAEFIAQETSSFDALMDESQRAIELLQERRTALISAAVTGRIDVRNVG